MSSMAFCIFFIMCVASCVYVCHIVQLPVKAKSVHSIPLKLELTDNCELFSMFARNQPLVLYKSSKCS